MAAESKYNLHELGTYLENAGWFKEGWIVIPFMLVGGKVNRHDESQGPS